MCFCTPVKRLALAWAIGAPMAVPSCCRYVFPSKLKKFAGQCMISYFQNPVSWWYVCFWGVS